MSIRIEIDESECLAYGDCAELAPGAFRVDDVATVAGRAPDQQLLDAAKACPSEAIRLIDTDTGDQLYP